ncbi:ComEA family DNA-binding protein [Halomonas halocynthiae]|uniref:ComEA family DNA-binding protein n=1 Tax=Halomonas halocynthiae TaxID=176290 RepID=UPI0003FB2179|nr:helix-hairpin-helix domain-containing protein [Halomonas halocynthiae]
MIKQHIARYSRLALLLLILGMATPTLAADPEKTNVNTANTEQLAELPGIGSAKAAEIIRDRESNGPFESAEDLTRVKGIGEAIASKVEDHISF